MQDLLHYLQDPANRGLVWAAVGFLFFEALILFLLARRWRNQELHLSRAGLRIRGGNAQVNTGQVGGDMILHNHHQDDYGDQDQGGDYVSLGLVFNLAAGLSSIVGLALAVFGPLSGP